MRKHLHFVVAIVLVCACLAAAKEKKKSTLPAYVLEAQTVFVMIDPDAGISMSDPGGNKTAQDDVEKALMRWGRLRPVLTMPADLVIVVRKGNGKLVQPTVGGEPTNDRPVIVQGTDNSIRVGAQQGRSPDGVENGGPLPQRPGMGTEVGSPDDAFLVYRGQMEQPLTTPPVWRYVQKNGLKSPDVPAVGEFKKAVDEAVKQQQQQQKQQGQQQTSKP
ncbi:MAG: hypothetical protein WBG02_16540 [Candidatus Acidiferrum sp.]